MRAVFALVLLAACAAPGAAQQAVAGVEPDTITVGGLARVAIRLELPAEYRAAFPDTLPLGGDLENSARRLLESRPLPDGGREVTATYTVTGWRPGRAALPSVEIGVAGPADRRAIRVELPSLYIESVLPEDTAGIEPRPPADVLGRNWPLGALALVAAGLLLAAAAVLFWARQRRGRMPAPAAAPVRVGTPRERALRALDAARAEGLLEAGELKEFYSRITAAVRHLLHESAPAWGADLTTSELLPRLRGDLEDRRFQRLERLLNAADAVKFARRRPTAEEAMADWSLARAWVEDFAVPGGEPAPAEPAAMGGSSGAAPAAGGGGEGEGMA